MSPSLSNSTPEKQKKISKKKLKKINLTHKNHLLSPHQVDGKSTIFCKHAAFCIHQTVSMCSGCVGGKDLETISIS